VADSTQQKPAAAVANPMLALSTRVYDLSALLNCIGHQLEAVHDIIEARDNSDEVDKLWQTLRAIRHCEALAGQIATDVEEAPHA
jgi:hypothetical protein